MTNCKCYVLDATVLHSITFTFSFYITVLVWLFLCWDLSRAVCSPNQRPYWSMSVFVSVLVCGSSQTCDPHTLSLTQANMQTQHGLQMYRTCSRPTDKYQHVSCSLNSTLSNLPHFQTNSACLWESWLVVYQWTYNASKVSFENIPVLEFSGPSPWKPGKSREIVCEGVFVPV